MLSRYLIQGEVQVKGRKLKELILKRPLAAGKGRCK
jgi:hypothetical protein